MYLFIIGLGGDVDEAADSDRDCEAERQVDGFGQRPCVHRYRRVDGLTQRVDRK